MGVMQQFNEPNIITTTTDKAFNWARKNSLWPLQFGLACCAIEMMSTGMAHNDLERFGSSPFMGSPRQADVMIVSGTVSTKMAERMTRLYEQMPDPKWVIAMGACAISGGPFLDGYSVLMGADRVIPVDVYVPGCPPRPEALIFGIMTLQKKIEREQQVGGKERPAPALVDEDGTVHEYLPEKEYQEISEGKAPQLEGIRYLKRTYTFERKGMPPGAQTDVGWLPKEVKKKLKEEEKARKEAEKKAAEEKEANEAAEAEKSGGAATATAEKPKAEGKADGGEAKGEAESAKGEAEADPSDGKPKAEGGADDGSSDSSGSSGGKENA
jgi:NADH-quinone oxidoreductase subunit B